MSDTRVPDEVLMALAASRGSIQQAWRAVERLRGYARGAERAVEDADAETVRARMAPDSVPGGGAYIARAGDQMDVVRQRCALSSNLASEIEEWLDTAKRHLDAARGRLDSHARGGDLSAEGRADVASLRTKVEDLAGLVELAVPLVQAARVHMQEAAEIAAQRTAPPTAEDRHDYAVLQVDRRVQTAGRSVARAEEVSRHLDRAVEYANVGAARSLGHAEGLANSAHERLRATQQHASAPFSTRTPASGLSR